MSSEEDLYQQIILDHAKAPRNQGSLEGSTHQAKIHNPLCGDRVAIGLVVNGERIERARFEGRGCAIAIASASMLSEAVRGKTTAEAGALAASVEALVQSGGAGRELGELSALGAVNGFVGRHRCATLAWEALRAALRGSE